MLTRLRVCGGSKREEREKPKPHTQYTVGTKENDEEERNNIYMRLTLDISIYSTTFDSPRGM